MNKYWFLAALIVSLSAGCGSREQQNNKRTSKPTSGYIKIAADEALKPIVEAEVNAFTGLYPSAKIDVFYVSEQTAIDTLLKDSVTAIFISRNLLADEKQILTSRSSKAKEEKIAIGGIALIVNPSNPDTLLTLDHLKDILSGKVNNWNQLSKKRAALPLKVVFDQPKSGMIKFLNDSLMPLTKLPPNCFAVDSNAAVVDYVSRNPEAIGLIDISWISDEDDETVNVFRNSIKVVGLATQEGEDFSKPFQAYISMGRYPLKRNVFMTVTESYTGLATGFSRFVASDKGQRIILKSGLVPATMPVRIVETNRGGF
ncbi:PstS family phosphate ABC transporter substrate-binding protein [Pseudochryseolinea flava]|nr:substrate-binding domain-containing protein [Pseudochryseolinea flava]